MLLWSILSGMFLEQCVGCGGMMDDEKLISVVVV